MRTDEKCVSITQHFSRDGMTNGFKVVVPNTNAVEVRQVKQISTNNKSNGNTQPYQQDRIYDVNGISPALQAQLSSGSAIINTPRIRRLTPLECKRLQTVDDNYLMPVSDTQIYKQLGNGWTVDVIAHIFSYMKF
jgi:site-specific DNA-cytosine methylase